MEINHSVFVVHVKLKSPLGLELTVSISSVFSLPVMILCITQSRVYYISLLSSKINQYIPSPVVSKKPLIIQSFITLRLWSFQILYPPKIQKQSSLLSPPRLPIPLWLTGSPYLPSEMSKMCSLITFALLENLTSQMPTH